MNNEVLSAYAYRHDVNQLTYIEETRPASSGLSNSAMNTLQEINATRILDQEVRAAFDEAISSLGSLFTHVDNSAEPVSRTFMWISASNSQVHDLLQQHHPFALVILAHYCVILHRLRWLWWISSWGQRVLLAIDRVLDPKWRPGI